MQADFLILAFNNVTASHYTNQSQAALKKSAPDVIKILCGKKEKQFAHFFSLVQVNCACTRFWWDDTFFLLVNEGFLKVSM